MWSVSKAPPWRSFMESQWHQSWPYDWKEVVVHTVSVSSFLQAGCHSCRPTNSVKALKGKMSHPMDLLTPNSSGSFPTLSLTTNSSWWPWGRFAMPLISRERRQSSATEHSPSQVLWCGTVYQRQLEIPAPCQTSNLLWSLTCLLDYILEAAPTITICDGPLNRFYVLWRHRNHCRIIIIWYQYSHF